jgi:hypothetical protein
MDEKAVRNFLSDLQTAQTAQTAQTSQAGILVEQSNRSLTAYPKNKEDVIQIVKAARKWQVPLRPKSSAVPTDYLQTGAQNQTGSQGQTGGQDGVVVNMTGLRSIRKIDAYSRYAWIDAGVTFGELLPALAENGLKLNHPLLPSANKSVVTSMLEREPVLMPKYQYDNVDPLFTVEAVYGTGDEFRTGSASGPGSLENLKADKVNPWGPGPVDFVRFLSGAQGTMGLVTWAVVKTEIAPSMQKIWFVSSEEIGPLTDMLTGLLRRRAVDECLILDRTNLSLLNGTTAAALPAFTLICRVSGYQRYPEERIRIQEGYLHMFCREQGLSSAETLPGGGGGASASASEVCAALDRCGEELSWKTHLGGGYRDIFFLAPLSKVNTLVTVMKQTAVEHGFPAERLGIYIQPGIQGRSSHVEFTLYYDREVAAQTAAADALFEQASKTLITAGAYFSRPYGIWADLVYSRDPEGTQMLRKMKDIFDPGGILNPGVLCF